MMRPKDIEQLMKRCQIGVGGGNALEHAHDIMAECYGTLGFMLRKLLEYRKKIINIEIDLKETEDALIDIWKAFSPPRTADETRAVMDKHQKVLDRILERERK